MRWPAAITALLLLAPAAAWPAEPSAAAPAAEEPPVDGAALYGKYCSKCHGANGAGLGLKRDKKLPDFSSAAWQAKTTDQDIRKIIEYGGPPTLGMKKMAFKVALEPQIVAIIAYVRTLGAEAKPAGK